MIIKIEIDGKIYNVEAWGLGKEKEALLSFISINNEPSFKEKIEILSNVLIPNIKCDNYMDKFYIMVKVAAAINMDYKGISFVCPHCGAPCNNTIDISKNLKYYNKRKIMELCGCKVSIGNDIDDIEIVDGDKEINDILDSLTIKEVKNIKESCKNNHSDLYLETDSLCVMCMKKTHIIRDKNDLLENYIIGIDTDYYYKTLKYFLKELNFSITEFNNLYPFEVDVLTRKDEK